MLNLTNAEADHLARRAEKAANMLRSLAAHHRTMEDAMHVVGEEALETYHRSMASIVLGVASDLEADATDLRARRKPKTPSIPPDLHIGHIRPDRYETRRQQHGLERAEQRALASFEKRA